MLLFNSLLFAISASIDALGIGITYGLRKIKLSNLIKNTLFFISFCITLFSGIVGLLLKKFFSILSLEFLPPIILILIGIYILTNTKKNNLSKKPKLNILGFKETFALGFSISLDSLCIGLGAGSFGVNIFLFSFLSAFFHYSFLNLGNIFGEKLINFNIFSSNTYLFISGILLILIGLLGIFL